jgi:hypothetical protein
LSWPGRFHQAGSLAFAALYPDRSTAFADAISSSRAVMQREGIERPVGIGDHVDCAFRAQSKRALSEAKSYGMSVFQRAMQHYVTDYKPTGIVASADATAVSVDTRPAAH